MSKNIKKRHWGAAFLTYLLLLAASSSWRGVHEWQEEFHSENKPALQRFNAAKLGLTREAETLVLIYTDPGRTAQITRLAEKLSRDFHILVPDLPNQPVGTAGAPVATISADARHIAALIRAQNEAKVHLVGIELGGAIAVQLSELRPEMVASVTLVSAMGVPELELLGQPLLNHAIYGAQSIFYWSLLRGTPHFGLLNPLENYIRRTQRFYGADFGAVRAALSQIEQPVAIFHGQDDLRVPVAAAREHSRLAPQAQLKIMAGGHHILQDSTSKLARDIQIFIEAASSHKAATRSQVDPQKLALATQPFDPESVPPLQGQALLMVFLLLALSTLLSEDLTCIAAGLMVAAGTIGFLPATAACFTGIFVGDMMLYMAGKILGRSAVKKAPLRWVISQNDLEQGEKWFQKRGVRLIFASRFVPGTRLPTYVAAGVLGAKFALFTLVFAAASLVWTPALVGLATVVGTKMLAFFETFERFALPALLLGIGVMWLILKFLLPLFSYRGRRLMHAKSRRLVRWEFWPLWVFYIPIFSYVVLLYFRYRRRWTFTAVNPSMPLGGLIGESKSEILAGLGGEQAGVAGYRLLPYTWDYQRKKKAVEDFIQERNLSFPVVIKPDRGERGAGVCIAENHEQIASYLQEHSEDVLIQEFVGGEEYGIFYVRMPGEVKGHIISITIKQLTAVTGDGVSTLERLILNHPRAHLSAARFLKDHREHLEEVPPQGQKVPLVKIGTHSRGALFLDGNHLKTPQLETAVDRICQNFDGFYFGRFDVKVPSEADLCEGKNLKIIELNGVTSECTDIYDPANSLWHAYRVMFRQWSLAFEVGKRLNDRGHEAAGTFSILSAVWQARNNKFDNI